MRGFWPLAAFELRLHLRRISTWVYFGVFLLLGFFLTAAAAGAWPDFDTGDPLRVANAPVRVARTLLTLGLLGVPVTLGVVGGAVHRDFQTGIYPLFFSTPLSPARYLGGRYAGAVLANLAMLLGAPLGMALAAASPWVDPARVHPFQPLAYLHPLLLLVVPNLLVTGALFLVLAAHTRRMLAVYAGAMGLLLAYGVSLLAMQALEADWLTWALDPFGLVPALRATRYWTVVEQNRDYLPAAGPLLWNRALWLGIGAAVLAAGMVRFRFAHYADERLDARGEAAAEERPVAPHELARRLSVPPAARSFSARARWAQLRGELRRSLHEVMGNVYFPIIVGCCLAFVLAAAAGMGEMYGTRTYPVTWQVLELLFGTFFLFVVGVITFYAGELVWHEREVGTAQLHDSAPVPTWLPLAAKVAALTAVVLALLAAAMGVGILIQLSRGYYRFEPGLYLRELFLHQLSFYFPLLVLAIAIQTVVAHKYLGHFLMLLYYVGSPVLYLLGLEHNLFHYAASPDVVYSDMNGYGPGWVPVFWYGLLWALAALLLAVGTHLFWVRGQETAGRARLRLARLRLTRPLLAVAGAAGVLVAATAGFIGYNTAVLNDWETSDEQERGTARYERRYRRFAQVPQPRVAGVRLEVDLSPRAGEFRARGSYRLVNRSGVAIDSIHVDLPSTLRVRGFAFDRPARRVLADPPLGYYVYRLARPLAPGDSLEFRFDVAEERRGFEDEPAYGPVVANGTFLHSEFLPKLGYNPAGELTDEGTRERHGLPPRPRAAPRDDPRARSRNYIAYDADWTGFEAVLSTPDDQVAVAPGSLVREWRRGGRRWFHYRADAPVLHFYAFLSARYRVRRDRWNGVDIEVYHHPVHRWNVERMVRSVKASLACYTRAFGPYPHRQLRIVEFPRFAAFAQSFASTIPYSESIGFIAEVRPGDLDYPFFVTAHEVAHQWWGHQLVGADAQGAALLSETLSEYSALLVMEQEYGRAQIGRFLRHELDGYLTGRGGERRGETPLVRVEGQTYVHYHKGSLAMYALRDHLGEARLNAALRRFLRAHRFRGPPYPTSADLMRHLRAATPDSLRYVLDDLFEHVTLHANRARAATAWREGGEWVVELRLEGRKVRADSLGRETEVAMDDRVDVGVFAAGEEEPVYLRKHRLRSGAQTVRVRVRERPARAGVDPLHKLIDRELDDNLVPVRVRP